jgi:hypothetical protein
MRVRVTSTIEELERDLRKIPVRAQKEKVSVVREGLRTGNSMAVEFARKSAGRHGKRYPRAFSVEMHGAQSALTGGSLTSGEYGPDADKPQGGMSFERGSRNQKAHLDLARSADFVVPAFQREVGDMIDRLFW